MRNNFLIKVVGHPKNDKFRGVRLLSCRWCSDIFVGYKKDFFFKHTNGSEAGGPIKKKQSLKHHICSKIRVVGYTRMIEFRGGRLLYLSLVFRYVY